MILPQGRTRLDFFPLLGHILSCYLSTRIPAMCDAHPAQSTRSCPPGLYGVLCLSARSCTTS